MALALALAALQQATGCPDNGEGIFPDGGPPPGGDARWADSGPPPPSIRIHAIDVGAGLCVLVEMPDPSQPVLLVDCGQDVWKGAGVSATTVSEYARKIIGTRRVALAVSHPHSDHYSLVDNVLDRGGPPLELTTVWLGGRLDDYTADGQRMKSRIVTFRNQHPGKVHDGLPRTYHSPYPKGEPELTFGAVKAYVLAVNESKGAPKADVNGQSQVLVIKYGSFMAVLPGDADGEVQVLAAQHAKAMGLPLSQAALLLASHHGSGTYGSNDQAWADAVRPQVMVYSAGRDVDNPTLKMHNGHPFHTVVSRFEAHPALRGAANHRLYQGLSSHKAAERQTGKAHYVSASNGVVTIASTGQQGNLRVTCTAHSGTSRDTACALK